MSSGNGILKSGGKWVGLSSRKWSGESGDRVGLAQTNASSLQSVLTAIFVATVYPVKADFSTDRTENTSRMHSMLTSAEKHVE